MFKNNGAWYGFVVGVSLGALAASYLPNHHQYLVDDPTKTKTHPNTTQRNDLSTFQRCPRRKGAFIIEICVSDIESVAEAAQGGASSIELCANRKDGGTTPSTGLIQESLKLFPGEIHVLIRPRPGNFVYTTQEFEVILKDAAAAQAAGATGELYQPGAIF
jgi:hypothetical protein